MSDLAHVWQHLIRETIAYLKIARAAGFSYVEGSFNPPPDSLLNDKSAGRVSPPSGKRLSAGISPQERQALKAALTDPYAHLAARPARQAAPKSRPSRSASAPRQAKSEKPKVLLRDRAKGLQLIASAQSLEELNDLIAGCQMCGLAPGRTNVVPGEGNPEADLVFVGEAPGYNEDLQGRPFVGRAGALLTDMIQAMGLQRQDVFICNIIKCRPPGNRDPRPDEMKACEPFLKRQLELIRPKVICALGRIAIQSLLRETTPMGKLRGKWRSYQGIPLMPTYHPAYLLRNESQKRYAWEDLKAVMARLAELNQRART